jgi:hypothetical protein
VSPVAGAVLADRGADVIEEIIRLEIEEGVT